MYRSEMRAVGRCTFAALESIISHTRTQQHRLMPSQELRMKTKTYDRWTCIHGACHGTWVRSAASIGTFNRCNHISNAIKKLYFYRVLIIRHAQMYMVIQSRRNECVDGKLYIEWNSHESRYDKFQHWQWSDDRRWCTSRRYREILLDTFLLSELIACVEMCTTLIGRSLIGIAYRHALFGLIEKI